MLGYIVIRFLRIFPAGTDTGHPPAFVHKKDTPFLSACLFNP